jgi:hypothetical protein
LPTEYWLKAAESSILLPRRRKEIGEAVWVRPVLLGNDVDGKRAAALLGETWPELRDGLQSYEDASTPDEKRFAAALLPLGRPEDRSLWK